MPPALAALLLVLVLLMRGTHLTGAAAVSVGAADDKEVAPVGDVTTDLLSLEPEIGGSLVRREEQGQQRGARRERGIFLSVGFPGYPFGGWGSGYGWSLPGLGYGSYGLAPTYYGYYPGYLGYQKIIIG
ncbi:uncharacterized protein LOC108153919 [Drosophila miranda]|uniref:uncharacterized protein LOC108153919 n=1 Tax=Drosophila miranda TaxID=7229 RepID=UPI0007E7AA1F|nr:uncharacterized protein LOC108153919 [Drosophila miranda]